MPEASVVSDKAVSQALPAKRAICGIPQDEIQRNAATILAMKSLKWSTRLLLFLLAAYCILLTWELTHWREVFFGASERGVAVGLLLRFVLLSLFIFYCLRAYRKEPRG